MKEAIKATDEGGHQGVSSEALGRAAPSRAPSTPHLTRRGVPSGGASPPNQTSSEAIRGHQPSSRGVPSGGASPPNSLLHRPAHGRRVTSDGIRATRCKGAREVGHTRLEGRLGWLAVVFGGRAEDGGNQRSLVRSSEAIRGDQSPSEVIRGDQRQSEVIS